MVRQICEDCWPPLPGSWEEVVDPYDVQLVRMQPSPREDASRQRRTKTRPEHQQPQVAHNTR